MYVSSDIIIMSTCTCNVYIIQYVMPYSVGSQDPLMLNTAGKESSYRYYFVGDVHSYA